MLLKSDHRELEALFEKFEKTNSSAKKQEIALTICAELKVHTMIEEELFYPAFRGKIEDDTPDEAYVEHDGAKMLINDIETSGREAEFYVAKVKVLSEEIKHHVHEEEKPKEGMFAQCRATDVDLVALRDVMLARKKALLAQAKTAGLPTGKSDGRSALAGLTGYIGRLNFRWELANLRPEPVSGAEGGAGCKVD